MKNGVPYDRAFEMDPIERRAHYVVFGQFEGGKWDWDRQEWKNER